MDRAYLPFYSGIAGFCLVGVACLIARDLRGPRAVPGKLMDPPVISRPASVTITLPIVAQAAATSRGGRDGHYEKLRASVRWVRTRLGSSQFATPDYESRLILAKSAAERANLAEVGLGYRDVYGIINAETSWVPRTGKSKDGTPNLGVAQFEPATARALGLRDPDDLVESVHVAAVHMKEAALWSTERIAGLKLDAQERADKLREGVSVYYNLSSRGRAGWNGLNTARLPTETQRHIVNARLGAQEAAMLDGQLQAARYARGAGQALAFAATGRSIN